MDSPMPARLPLLRLPILVVLLALSGLLLAGAAHAAPLVPGVTPLAFEEEFAAEDEDEGEEDEGEGEIEEGACEEAEEELDEGELSVGEVKEICEEEAAERRKKATNPGTVAPQECILRSAHGQAVTSGKGDKLKLTIGYTTYEPAAASLKIGRLGTVHRHLGRRGVLRLVENLHGHDGPKHLSVQIDIPSAKSAGCPFRRLVLSPR
jgi:hypothetical protein